MFSMISNSEEIFDVIFQSLCNEKKNYTMKWKDLHSDKS